MGTVDLDALARQLGVSTDSQLADELTRVMGHLAAGDQEVGKAFTALREVAGAQEALHSALLWIDEADQWVRRALGACEDHERGVA